MYTVTTVVDKINTNLISFTQTSDSKHMYSLVYLQAGLTYLKRTHRLKLGGLYRRVLSINL